MATFDIIILVIMALPAIVGLMYGFLNIVFSLLAWILAMGLAAKLLPYSTPLLIDYVSSDELRAGLAFIISFIVLLMLLSGIGYLIVKLIGRAGLSAADRFLGLLFGMSLGLIIVNVIIFLAGFTAFPKDAWWQASRLAPAFQRVAVKASEFLPEGMAKYHEYPNTESEIEPEQQIDSVEEIINISEAS